MDHESESALALAYLCSHRSPLPFLSSPSHACNSVYEINPPRQNIRLYICQHGQHASYAIPFTHSASLHFAPTKLSLPPPCFIYYPPPPPSGGLKFHHRSRNPPSTSTTAGRRRRRPQLPTHPHPQRKIPHLPHAEYHPHRRRPIPRPVIVVTTTTTSSSLHPRRIPPPHHPPQQQRPPRIPQRRAPGHTRRRSAATAPAGGGGTGARPLRAPQLPAHDAAEVREALGQRAEEGRGRGPGEVPRAAVRGAGEEAEHHAAWVDCGCVVVVVVVVVVVAGGEESSGDGSVCPGHGLGEMDFRSSISSGGGGGGGGTSGVPSSHPRREVRDDRHRRPPVVELHVVPVDLVPVTALERVVAEAGEVSEVEGRGHQGRRDGREGDDEVFVPSPPEIRAQAVDQVRHGGEGRVLLHVQVDPIELVAPQKVAEGAVVRLKIRARGEEGVGALCGAAEHAEDPDRGGFAEDEDFVPELGELWMGGGVVVEG